MTLNGDAAFALEVHGVEVDLHLSGHDGTGTLESIGQGRLADRRSDDKNYESCVFPPLR